MGLATLTVGRFNILSITLVPILIGLAVDYGVHLICRYEEELCRGRAIRPAIRKVLKLTGRGVITAASTIAGAFFVMVLTDFRGMQEMGLIAGIGVIVCLVPMLTLLPLLLVRSKPDVSVRRVTQQPPSRRSPLILALRCPGEGRGASRATEGGRCRIERINLQHPSVKLVFCAAITILAIAGSLKVEFDYDLLNLQSRGLPAVRMQKQLISAGSQSLLYCAVIADSLPQAAEWEQRITRLPSVDRVISLVKYLTEDQERKLLLVRKIKQELGAISSPELDGKPVNLTDLGRTLFSLQGYVGRAMEAIHSGRGDPAWDERLSSLRNSVSRLLRLTASDRPSAASRLTTFQQMLFASLHESVRLVEQQDDRQRLQPEDVPPFLRDAFISSTGKFLLQVYPREDVWQRDRQQKFVGELRTVDPNVTGSPVQFYEYTSRLRKNVQIAAAYAAGVIAILVFFHFRRLSAVLLALLPVALGVCWMMGLMGWLGIAFNPVNIVSLILVIGIGVTNGIHILNRFAEKSQPNILSGSTGKAVLVSGLNTIAGFGSLLIAKHQGIASLGGVMAIGTGTCVAASLIFLPAVLTLLCRTGWRLTDPPKESA